MKQLIVFTLIGIIVFSACDSPTAPVNDGIPPGVVTDLIITEGDGSVEITWTDPPDSDFDHVNVYYGESVPYSEYSGAVSSSGTTISSLTNGTTYTFVLRTVDTNGNESSGESITGTPAAPVMKYDYLFIIDMTGTMSTELPDVVSGIKAFLGEVGSVASIDVQYSIVLRGYLANPLSVALEWTGDKTTVSNTLDTLALGSSQNNDAFLEALRIVLGAAPINTIAGGPVTFRAGAEKIIVQFTDEASNAPYYSENLFPDQTTNAVAPSALYGGWLEEIDVTASDLIDNEVSVILFINRNDSPSVEQFGDPNLQVQNADFTSFNTAATYSSLNTEGYTTCIQTQLLNTGIFCRVVDISDAADHSIQNVFLSPLLD